MLLRQPQQMEVTLSFLLLHQQVVVRVAVNPSKLVNPVDQVVVGQLEVTQPEDREHLLKVQMAGLDLVARIQQQQEEVVLVLWVATQQVLLPALVAQEITPI